MRLVADPLTAEAFAPFGDVIEARGPFRIINEGQCRRFHDLANIDILGGEAGVNLFTSEIRPVPYTFDLLERHPLGSQCFMPMDGSAYLVIVAPDVDGQPGVPRAFLATPAQGVNYARDTWHGVLAPISGGGLFAVVDRIGPGANLVEARLELAVSVTFPG